MRRNIKAFPCDDSISTMKMKMQIAVLVKIINRVFTDTSRNRDDVVKYKYYIHCFIKI